MTSASDQSDLQSKRVLLVEDTLLVANEIDYLLKEQGCEVVGPVPRLDQAVEMARNESIDLGVLDVNLEGEYVYPVADELQQRGIPFIFMTGYDVGTLDARYKDAPSIEKPFHAPDFIAAMQGLFIRAGSTSRK